LDLIAFSWAEDDKVIAKKKQVKSKKCLYIAIVSCFWQEERLQAGLNQLEIKARKIKTKKF